MLRDLPVLWQLGPAEAQELPARRGPNVREHLWQTSSRTSVQHTLTNVVIEFACLSGCPPALQAPDGGETPADVRAARKAAVVRAQGLIDKIEGAKVAGGL